MSGCVLELEKRYESPRIYQLCEAARIIACIEDANVITKIVRHVDAKAVEPETARRSPYQPLPHKGIAYYDGVTPPIQYFK